MKITLTLFAILALNFCSEAQQTINASITHDALTRDYILYVPASYDGTQAYPLLFNFHGYTSNAAEQMFYGDFRPIADTARFLIVHPQGTLDGTGEPHFNVGFGGSSVDDVGFTSALIDSLLLDYNINEDRIYSTGMSNGGYMSFHLACNLSSRFAAVGSVTGAMVPATMAGCNATHPTPIIQIHGTSDATVPYNGGAGWSVSIPNILTHWRTYNNCDATPVVTNVPNINTTDGSTVEKTVYENGDNCTEVVHFKVNSGGHTWPGSAFNIPITNYDIDASVEVWKFFSQYDINGKIDCATTSLDESELNDAFSVSPNPTNGRISVEGELLESTNYEIYSLTGERLLTGTVDVNDTEIDMSKLTSNVYFLRLGDKTIKVVVKVD